VWLPQTVRVRMSLLYAALFLVAGASLLAITYGLVDSSLPHARSSGLTKAQEAKATAECNSAKQPRPDVLSPGKPVPMPAPAACRAVFAAGAISATESQRDETLHNLLLFSLIGLGAMTLASGGIGWVMAGRVLGPVRSITATARRASEQHLGERLGLQGPRDELKELADTFDDMLDRLDAAFASQRRFVADASHELRTPLTVMRTAIDVTLAKPTRMPEQLEAMAAKVRRSVDHAESLIEALMTLAASDRELTRLEPVDLATIVEDTLDRAEPDGNIDVHVTTRLEPAPVIGDGLLLERLVGNLVDNAERHNVPGGWIDITTGEHAVDAHGARPSITIANSGHVIAETVVASLFEPFRRIEERTNARDGVGLGLAIVRSIATAHGATVEAQSQPQGGLVITVLFPAIDASALARSAPLAD
jgi:signal transduction histidine kinase